MKDLFAEKSFFRDRKRFIFDFIRNIQESTPGISSLFRQGEGGGSLRSVRRVWKVDSGSRNRYVNGNEGENEDSRRNDGGMYFHVEYSIRAFKAEKYINVPAVVCLCCSAGTDG
jgi:hypothetical protein